MAKTESYPSRPILVIDDDIQLLTIVEYILIDFGITNVIKLQNSSSVFEIVEKQNPLMILTDLSMPDISGEDIIVFMKENYPTIPVVVVSATDDVDKAIECVALGAYNYITKPVERTTLIAMIQNIIKTKNLEKELNSLKQTVVSDENIKINYFHRVQTQTKEVLNLFKYIEAIKHTIEPVLITGETGVGKELFAEIVHNSSNVLGKFVPVNMAGLDDNLFSDTLFGHSLGSFTDAKSERKGLIEEANNGTLFLDEIGDMSLTSQVKLLRLLQEKEYYPIGSDKPKKSNAKIVVATNIPLEKLKNSKEFRKDLFFRLSTHHIHIPPLRERKDDLEILANTFINEANIVFKKEILPISKKILTLLKSYSFPGNIRELRAIIFDLVGQSQENCISDEAVKYKLKISNQNSKNLSFDTPSSLDTLFNNIKELPTLKKIDMLLIKEAMKRTNNNQSVASKILGISQQALSQRLKKI